MQGMVLVLVLAKLHKIPLLRILSVKNGVKFEKNLSQNGNDGNGGALCNFWRSAENFSEFFLKICWKFESKAW